MTAAAIRHRLLDASIQLIAERGYLNVGTGDVAGCAGVDLPVFRQQFHTDSDWIEACYAHIFARRVEVLEKLVHDTADHSESADRAVRVFMAAFMNDQRPSQLIAAQYDLFFMSRGNRVLSARLARIREQGDKALSASAGNLFPAAVPAGIRQMVLVHFETIACIAVSNGFGTFAMLDSDMALMKGLITGGGASARTEH